MTYTLTVTNSGPAHGAQRHGRRRFSAELRLRLRHAEPGQLHAHSRRLPTATSARWRSAPRPRCTVVVTPPASPGRSPTPRCVSSDEIDPSAANNIAMIQTTVVDLPVPRARRSPRRSRSPSQTDGLTASASSAPGHTADLVADRRDDHRRARAPARSRSTRATRARRWCSRSSTRSPIAARRRQGSAPISVDFLDVPPANRSTTSSTRSRATASRRAAATANYCPARRSPAAQMAVFLLKSLARRRPRSADGDRHLHRRARRATSPCRLDRGPLRPPASRAAAASGDRCLLPGRLRSRASRWRSSS